MKDKSTSAHAKGTAWKRWVSTIITFSKNFGVANVAGDSPAKG